jgi:hypothetical protein
MDFMRTARVLRTAGLLVMTLAIASCGDKLKMADVNGTVTVDNKPVENGAITFFPEDGVGPTAGGRIEEGEYAVKVPPGKMKVTISASKQVGMKKLYAGPNAPERPVYKELLPAKYNDKTELRYEVQPGNQEKNFTLSTK